MSRDVYQDSFNYCSADSLNRSLDGTFPVRRARSSRDPGLRQKVLVFNHIGQSGGGPINDLILRTSPTTGVSFLIPDYYRAWDPATYSAPKPLFISAHYLNGFHKKISWPCAYFTLVRDPVRLWCSVFLNRAYVFAGRGLTGVWAAFERHLDEWRDVAGHANLQTFEIATDDADKRFRHSPETPPDVFIHDIRNYPGTRPEDLYRAATAKIDGVYFLVGITELFEETLFLLFDALGIDQIPLWRPGIYSYWRPPANEIPIRLLRKIRKLTEADAELYDRQRQRLEEQIAENDFGNALLEYKIACRNPTHRLILEVHERLETARQLVQLAGADAARIQMEVDHVQAIRARLDAAIEPAPPAA